MQNQIRAVADNVYMKHPAINALFLGLVLALSARSVEAQMSEQALMARLNTGAYKTIERSNWSRYDNGRYIGHVYRETRALIQPVSQDENNLLYRGNFFLLEETLRDMQQSARAVDEIIPASFIIYQNGSMEIEDDRGFPALRGFPTFPAGRVNPGTKWTAEGLRIIDPLNDGFPVAVPILAEYEYRGIETYKGIPVYRISARYASRYNSPSAGSGFFISVTGTHQVEILLRISDGLPLLMMDNLDETFTWAGGKTVRFRGFTQTFGEGNVPLNTEETISSIASNGAPRNPASGGPNAPLLPDEWERRNNIEITPVPGGVKLTVKDIRFVADSDQFLASEYGRLDIIAEALRNIPDRTFLVEGHTAAIGQTNEEMELSIQRARRMVDEMVRRGIGADRFMFKGWGGSVPIGDNSTEEGRALNRRVEITILE